MSAPILAPIAAKFQVRVCLTRSCEARWTLVRGSHVCRAGQTPSLAASGVDVTFDRSTARWGVSSHAAAVLEPAAAFELSSALELAARHARRLNDRAQGEANQS